MSDASDRPCPLCGAEAVAPIRLRSSSIDHLLVSVVHRVSPDWDTDDGLCRPCFDQVKAYVMALAAEETRGQGRPGEINGSKLLPTPWRLLAHPDLRGAGVTMCFIDSGFLLHPDLVYPRDRVRRLVDVTHPGRKRDWFRRVHPATSWHGTMAAVVAAGSGFLSGGWYRGIAGEADLVLIKTANDQGRITGEAIADALRWVLKNHRRHRIRVVNLSVTDDDPRPTSESPVNQAVEELTRAGVVVVAAVGNDPAAAVKPPASAPSAIAVGGLDDENAPAPLSTMLYPSTFGRTLDEVWKPEILAPAIWLAAPILPGTPQQNEAAALFYAWDADDWRLKSVLAQVLEHTTLEEDVLELPPGDVRQAVFDRIQAARFVSPHYQHADGTSFAAPIVASVVAQLIEADPRLAVDDVRAILLSSARALPGPARRQGFGLLRPLSAAERALNRGTDPAPARSPTVHLDEDEITFDYSDALAGRVSLSGDWLGWPDPGTPLAEIGPGRWQVVLELPPPGEHRYKLIVDGRWRPDPRNPEREPDGLEGFNSLFVI